MNMQDISASTFYRTYIYTYIRTYIHAYMHACIHTYICVCMYKEAEAHSAAAATALEEAVYLLYQYNSTNTDTP